MDKGPHGCDIDDLEFVQVYGAVGGHVFVDLTQNAKQSDIGLASSLEGGGREGDEEEKKV